MPNRPSRRLLRRCGLPVARSLRPLALLLASMLAWAGMVTVEAPVPPTLVIDETAFALVGSSQSNLVFAGGSVTVHYRLDPYQSLILEATDLPAAVQRLEWHLIDHRICSPWHPFVEVGFFDPLASVTFPELGDPCHEGAVSVADETIVVCHGAACQADPIASYRPPFVAADEAVGFGVFHATYALVVDVAAGESFAGPITMRYSVDSGLP